MNNPNIQAIESRNIVTTENQSESTAEVILKGISWFLVLITFPISMLICLTVLTEFQRAVIFRLGRLRKGCPRGPGLVFLLPCIDDFVKVDLRTTSFDVPPQEILTKDSVTIKLDAVVYYRLDDPLRAIIQISNVREATRLLAQTTLRNVVGTKMLTELLTSKETLSVQIGQILDDATERWGVKVERVEIKDIRLPVSMQRAMASEAEALREAQAKIVAAEGEMSASQALKEASDIMTQNPMTLQLRYLQTLANISTERNSTIIFPFPIDIMDIKTTQSGASGSGN